MQVDTWLCLNLQVGMQSDAGELQDSVESAKTLMKQGPESLQTLEATLQSCTASLKAFRETKNEMNTNSLWRKWFS